MSGTLPASPAPARVEIGSIQPSLVSIAHSLARKSRTLGGQRFTFRLSYPPMTHAQFAPIWGFLIGQRGQYDTFSWALPSRVWPFRGYASGTPTVNNQSGSPEELQTGSRNVATSGWPPAQTNVMRAGDLVAFVGHGKIYSIRQDIDADSNGSATLAIEPALVAGPAHASLITRGTVTVTVSLAGDVQKFEALPRAGSLQKYRFDLDLIEAY